MVLDCFSSFLTLVSTCCPSICVNEPVKDDNQLMLDKLQKLLVMFDADHKLSERCSVLQFQVGNLKITKSSQTVNLVSVSKLNKCTRVIPVANVNIEDGVVNGLIDKVMRIKFSNTDVESVHVSFSDTSARSNQLQSGSIVELMHGYYNIDVKLHLVLEKNKPQPYLKGIQFCLTISWNSTVKDLGLDFSIISFDFNKKRFFIKGQMYLVLRRTKTLENLCLIGKYSSTAVKESLLVKLQ